MISLAETCVFEDSTTIIMIQKMSSMIGVTDKRMLRFPGFIIIE
jgi:hypothetical protein